MSMKNNWPTTVDELVDECEWLKSRYDLYTLGKRDEPFLGECEPMIDGTDYLAGEYQYGIAMVPAQWVTSVLGDMKDAGTCRNIAELNREGVSGYFFVCSECGLAVHADRDINKTNYTCRKPDGSIDLRTFNSGGEYKFERCPRCGRKVTE